MHHENACNRRDFLTRSGGGIGLLAMLALLDKDGHAAEVKDDPAGKPGNPLGPKPAHFKPTAKNVIWCFLDGGPSHIDLFDPKPELGKLDGKPLPTETFKRPVTAMGRTAYTPLLASKRKFKTAWPVGSMGERLVSGDRHLRG